MAQKYRRRNERDKVDQEDGAKKEKELLKNGSGNNYELTKFKLFNPLNEQNYI